MQNSNQHITKVEITQDKLVDILLHAATREDLANLAKEAKSDSDKLDTKIDIVRTETKVEFDKLEVILDDKFDKLEAKINDKFHKLEAKINDKFDKLEAKTDKIATESRSDFKQLAILIIGAILAPLVLHFFK